MSKLTDYIQNKNSKITIMEGREKEELRSLLDKEVTINNFDFLNGKDGIYAVFTIAEDEKSFYFASSIITENLLDIEREGLKEEVQKEGLKIKLTERKSESSKRNYIAVNFI